MNTLSPSRSTFIASYTENNIKNKTILFLPKTRYPYYISKKKFYREGNSICICKQLCYQTKSGGGGGLGSGLCWIAENFPRE